MHTVRVNATSALWQLPQYESPTAAINNHRIKYFFKKRSTQTRTKPQIKDKKPHERRFWHSIQQEEKVYNGVEQQYKERMETKLIATS